MGPFRRNAAGGFLFLTGYLRTGVVDPETAASVFLRDSLSPQIPSGRSASGKIIPESTLNELLDGSVTDGLGQTTT